MSFKTAGEKVWIMAVFQPYLDSILDSIIYKYIVSLLLLLYYHFQIY